MSDGFNWESSLDDALNSGIDGLIISKFYSAILGEGPFINLINTNFGEMSVSKAMAIIPEDTSLKIIDQLARLIKEHGSSNIDITTEITDFSGKEILLESEIPPEIVNKLSNNLIVGGKSMFESISELVCNLLERSTNINSDTLAKIFFIYKSLAQVMPYKAITYISFLTQSYGNVSKEVMQEWIERIMNDFPVDLRLVKTSNEADQLEQIERFINWK